MVKFAIVPLKYAPKRKILGFVLPQCMVRVGEFHGQDIVTWVNNIYQNKVFPDRDDFNAAYDRAIRPSEAVCWRNKTMMLTAEDLANFDDELKEGAFEDEDVKKTLARLKDAIASGEKAVFVY